MPLPAAYPTPISPVQIGLARPIVTTAPPFTVGASSSTSRYLLHRGAPLAAPAYPPQLNISGPAQDCELYGDSVRRGKCSPDHHRGAPQIIIALLHRPLLLAILLSMRDVYHIPVHTAGSQEWIIIYPPRLGLHLDDTAVVCLLYFHFSCIPCSRFSSPLATLLPTHTTTAGSLGGRTTAGRREPRDTAEMYYS